MSKELKKWMTLNAHGKSCLKSFMFSLSAGDLKTSELDYLNKKGITDYKGNYPDWEKRHPVSIECLTDLGIYTAKHYGFL